MTATIENRTDRRVMLRFNSGLTRYVGPYEVLSGIELAEVTNNDRLRHLEDKSVISLVTPLPEAGTARPPREPSGDEPGRRSRQMRADEAVEYIRRTPPEALEGFLSPDEDRISVLRAIEAKRNG